MRTQQQVGPSAGGLDDDFVEKYPELYPNHVAIAACIRAWAQRMDPQGDRPVRSSCVVSEDDFLLGYTRALRDMADLLVDGDGLPDGPLFPQTPVAQIA